MMKSRLRLACNVTDWLPSKADWVFAGNCIQVEERKRISEFHYKDDAKRCLVGRLLLRYALVVTTGIQWRDLHLVRSDKMKPILDCKHCSDVSFNASHQGDYVVVVTDSVNVGVDVMDKRESHGEVEEFFKIMTRQFTENEWKTIKSPNNPRSQMEAFYRNWCLKESYVKALGAGINHPLLSLNFIVNSPLAYAKIVTDTYLLTDGKMAHNWNFEESFLDANHIVAVAKNCREVSPVLSFEVIEIAKVLPHAQTLQKSIEVDSDFSSCFANPFKPKRKLL